MKRHVFIHRLTLETPVVELATLFNIILSYFVIFFIVGFDTFTIKNSSITMTAKSSLFSIFLYFIIVYFIACPSYYSLLLLVYVPCFILHLFANNGTSVYSDSEL